MPRNVSAPAHEAGMEEAMRAALEGSTAYVRQLASADLMKLLPEGSQVPPGAMLWALLDEEGSPIAVSEMRDAVIGHARANDMDALSVH